ncbi:MAG: pyridoxamine 5'-phosphate oxidase family protein [Candidatus Methanoperedens sp.]|nr:pyridoxamine 5'-phosphate oxidase family protein [Candidatus Methanoperedens sp.]MCE8425748.1 pyridoxamine 5'-phosphate oxidase family protein [Candidatus Methanoperedens sp.]
MRRKDKEIKDAKEIESIISRSDVCRIAVSENNSPYIVPVCFGYRDNCLFFHSAAGGKKIDIIKKNNRVCFEFDVHEGLIKSENLCNWDMKYHSVIGYGKAFFIDDFEEKTKALNIIAGHYSSDMHEYHKNSVDNVTIIKVDIENITGKKSGYL